MEALPKQNDKPKTVFIFGAGASYPDGVPLQAEIIPKILQDSDPQLKKSSVARRIRKFLTHNFSHKGQYPSLEEVFGFIKFFIANEMSLSKNWGNTNLRRLETDITNVIHYLISKNTRDSKNFSIFWKIIKEKKPEIGIVSTNYDTLLDDAFDSIYPNCLMDYCVEFVNYRHPDSIVSFDWWVDPKKPVTVFNNIIPTRIKVVKLHGSLNWKYCNCCGQVYLTPWQHNIDLKTNSFSSFIEGQVNECPFDGNKLSSLLQVPAHQKQAHNYIFNKLYDEASYLVGNAKQLVFIGYSFPEADVHIRALIRRCFAENGKVIVVNKSRAKDLRYRYESLAKNVKYVQMPFERFVKSDLFQEILAENRTLKLVPRFARFVRKK